MDDTEDHQPLPPELPIAVYGTLRPGCGNDGLWKGIATAVDDSNLLIHGFRLVSNGAFPYAVPDPDAISVGCLLVANPGCWEPLIRRCDRLEGVPHHYVRKEALVQRADTSVEIAWIYVPADVRHIARFDPVHLNDWAKRHDELVA